MHEAGIWVNYVANIHCGEDVYHNIQSIIVSEEDIDLRIPLRIDRILLYFQTRSHIPE